MKCSRSYINRSLKLIIDLNHHHIQQERLILCRNVLSSTSSFHQSLFLHNHTTSNRKEKCPHHQQVDEQSKRNTSSPETCPFNDSDGITKPVTFKTFEDIPGPKGLPILGNVIDLVKVSANPFDYFADLIREYGEIVKITAFNKKMILLANPEMMMELMKKDEGRITLEAFRKFKLERNMALAPVEMYYEENWQQVRQLFNVAMKPEFLETIVIPQVTELGSELLHSIVKNLKPLGNDTYELSNSINVINRYAFNTVIKTFLGVKMNDELAKQLPFDINGFVNNVVVGLDLVLRIQNGPPLFKLFKTKDYRTMEENMIQSFERAQYCIDLFGKEQPVGSKPRMKELLDERSKTMDRGQDNVTMVMASFLMAGSDVTSRVMSVLLHRIAHEPEYQDKLYEELEEVFGEPTLSEYTSENGLELTNEKLKKCKLVRNFVEENMRLNHLAKISTARRLSKDITVGEYLFEKDTQVMMFEDPQFTEEYIPNSTQFIPERHEKGNPNAILKTFPGPFGRGGTLLNSFHIV